MNINRSWYVGMAYCPVWHEGSDNVLHYAVREKAYLGSEEWVESKQGTVWISKVNHGYSPE